MESFDHPDQEDRLKAENEFLKMKLMLEHGAKFGGNENMELPAEVENQFLNNIAAFEKQFDQQKTIKVFDKIGRPGHFKPVMEIPGSEISGACKELYEYLNQYGIDLHVCSPNITVKELYRFTIEELFELETDDMDLPGWSTIFIYDEFYPDPVYENTRASTDECINYILEKQPMEWTHHFRKENLRLNQYYPLGIKEFISIVNRFKEAYDDLTVNEILSNHCNVDATVSQVTGSYSVTATNGRDTYMLSGNWKTVLEIDEKFGYWYIVEVEIEGIHF